MNARQLLEHTVGLLAPAMHATRRAALVACVQSLLNGSPACVTAIGRGIESRAFEKHKIKRADRLCSNPRLHAELLSLYCRLTGLFGRLSPHPLILVDWSDLDEYKRHFLLRASVVFSGRSITLYEEVHDRAHFLKPWVHRLFLQHLKGMLGPRCSPVLVSDAGFKTPWFREVQALGWYFVGRVRLPMKYQMQAAGWESLKALYKQATRRPKRLEAHLNHSNPFACDLVLYRGRAKGRHTVNCYGRKVTSSHAKKYTKRAKEPWVLAVSLPKSSYIAKRAVKIYQQRMQIEESFRDMKATHYGLGLAQSRTTQRQRLAVLILMVTIGNLMLLCLGLAMECAGLTRQYQANTVTKRRILSRHFLGMRGWRDPRLKLTATHWRQGIVELQVQCKQMDSMRIPVHG